MRDAESKLAAERIRTALELYEVGEAMMRAKLERDNPGATPAEIEALLVAWLRERPGAEHGDCPGRVLSWPLVRR